MGLVKSLQKDFSERAPQTGKEINMLCWLGGWAGDVLGAVGPTRHGGMAVWTKEQRFCCEITGEPKRFSLGVLKLDYIWINRAEHKRKL